MARVCARPFPLTLVWEGADQPFLFEMEASQARKERPATVLVMASRMVTEPGTGGDRAPRPGRRLEPHGSSTAPARGRQLREWAPMPRYRWLLFDADNTLFDFTRAESDALRLTFEQLGIGFEHAYMPVYQRVNREVWVAFEQGAISAEELSTKRFELLFDALGIEAEAEPFSAAYLPNLAMQGHLMPDALAVVRTLHDTYRIAMITNGLGDVQRPRLARSAIRDYIAELVISDEIGAAKPDRAIFDAAFLRMGSPRPDEVLLIGDSQSSDIAGGIAYGIDTCWFNSGGAPRAEGIVCTHEVRRLTELLAIL